jgi:plasmid replication initiation protein
MNEHEKKEIETKREYWVVKGNELIQKNRFELSLTEQKTIAFICSMIKKSNNAPYQLEYEFNIRDYCKVCGIDYAGGKNYKNIKTTLKHLSDRSMWLDDGESETLMRWLSYVKINKNSEKVFIEIDRTIAPFLFELKEKFTKYQLYNILAMKSAFSVRIYELLKSYAYQKNKTFDLEELKRLLEVENVKSYVRFPDFRRKVLEKAQEEINELTDLNISYKPITKGKKVIKIEFQIDTKSPIDRAIAGATANDRLNNTARN